MVAVLFLSSDRTSCGPAGGISGEPAQPLRRCSGAAPLHTSCMMGSRSLCQERKPPPEHAGCLYKCVTECWGPPALDSPTPAPRSRRGAGSAASGPKLRPLCQAEQRRPAPVKGCSVLSPTSVTNVQVAATGPLLCGAAAPPRHDCRRTLDLLHARCFCTRLILLEREDV